MRELQNASCHFRPLIINLKERNVEDVFEKIREKIKNHETINPLDLICSPLYNSVKSVKEVFWEAFLLMEQSFPDPTVTNQVAILMMGITQTLVDSESAEIMSEEVLEMIKKRSPFDNYFKEMAEKVVLEKAKKEGRQEERKETAVRALQKGLDNETVAEIFKLSLDEVMELAQTA